MKGHHRCQQVNSHKPQSLVHTPKRWEKRNLEDTEPWFCPSLYTFLSLNVISAFLGPPRMT